MPLHDVLPRAGRNQTRGEVIAEIHGTEVKEVLV